MQETHLENDAKQLYLSELDRIQEIIRFVCIRNCVYDEDRDDFSSWVHERLIDDDYAAIRKFKGRSSLHTYLATVIHNLLRDFRIKQWGKWRPSAAAKRLGTVAVQLETLIHRDQYGLEEAIRILQTNAGVPESSDRLRNLYAQLPRRVTRSEITTDALGPIPVEDRPERPLRDAEKESTAKRAESTLTAALAELEPEDRLVLKLNFKDGLTVALIARQLGLDQKRLYRRIKRNLRAIRAHFEEAGLGKREIADVYGWKPLEIALDFGVDDAEAPMAGPSTMGE